MLPSLQVDIILEQLGVFWANTEVVLDLLTKKGQHVEQFIGFSSKPRLMARFKERMEEYKRFWEGVRLMCSKYTTYGDERNMYGFLEKEDKTDSMDSVTSSFLSENGVGSPPHHHRIMEMGSASLNELSHHSQQFSGHHPSNPPRYPSATNTAFAGVGVKFMR